uniref:Membrane-associated guanylate kinase, WW and PDZ domain-containing protein 3 n=1 Tax=Schistosoma haematobium TaxID=6185 RepID=A0A095CGC5_SCHHA
MSHFTRSCLLVCTSCLKQVNQANIHLNSNKSTNNYLNLNKTTIIPTKETVTETNKDEMISFLRTVLNKNCHGKKSTNHNLQTNDKNTSLNTSELNNVNNLLMKRTREPWLPKKCISPGIGKSGPCDTPDYIPISQLLNTSKTNNHQINNSSYLYNMPQYDMFKQNQINEQQQSFTNYKHCDDSLLDRITSPCLSPPTQMKNSNNPMLNIPEVNTSNTNCNNFTEENPSIIPMEDNGSSGESSQNLVVGDLLVAIENHSVLSCKPSEIEELLRLAAKNNNGFVTLTVRRIHSSDKAECMKISEIPTKDSISSNIINVKLLKEKDEGFGFVIVSSLNKEKASEIGRIIPGSPADKCGQLEVGQRILAINGYCLLGINHMDIVNLIRQNQQQLILTIEKPGK